VATPNRPSGGTNPIPTTPSGPRLAPSPVASTAVFASDLNSTPPSLPSHGQREGTPAAPLSAIQHPRAGPDPLQNLPRAADRPSEWRDRPLLPANAGGDSRNYATRARPKRRGGGRGATDINNRGNRTLEGGRRLVGCEPLAGVTAGGQVRNESVRHRRVACGGCRPDGCCVRWRDREAAPHPPELLDWGQTMTTVHRVSRHKWGYFYFKPHKGPVEPLTRDSWTSLSSRILWASSLYCTRAKIRISGEIPCPADGALHACLCSAAPIPVGRMDL